MRLMSYFSSSDPVRGPARRRAAAFALTIAAHVLIILLLMTLAPPPPRPRVEPRPNIFRILPEPKPVEEPRAIAPKPVKREAGGSQPRAANPRPATATPPPPQASAKSPFGLIPGGMELFDAADIGKLPAHPEDREDGGSGDGAGKSANSGSVYGPGEGPGGDRLYDVDWVKRPTNAELSPYMPASVPPGSWAIIACRMVEHYQVRIAAR